jgi:hypothetical protein
MSILLFLIFMIQVTLGVGVMVKKYVVLVVFYDGLFCKV